MKVLLTKSQLDCLSDEDAVNINEAIPLSAYKSHDEMYLVEFRGTIIDGRYIPPQQPSIDIAGEDE